MPGTPRGMRAPAAPRPRDSEQPVRGRVSASRDERPRRESRLPGAQWAFVAAVAAWQGGPQRPQGAR